MVTFGEPEPEETPELTSAGRRKSGWHKKAANTWKTREREREAKAKRRTTAKGKPKITRSAPVEYPCPRCYAPVRDGECTGAYAVAHGGHEPSQMILVAPVAEVKVGA